MPASHADPGSILVQSKLREWVPALCTRKLLRSLRALGRDDIRAMGKSREVV